MPTTKVSFEFTDDEQNIIEFMDQLRTAISTSNRLGEGEWRWLADGISPSHTGHGQATIQEVIMNEAGAYWLLDTLLQRVALQFFDGNDELANNLRELVLDNGESIRYNLEHNAYYVIRGLGVHMYGGW